MIHSIDTSIAVVHRDEQGVIRIRVASGAKLDPGGFAEILAARMELAEGRPARVIALVPDDVDFDIHIMNKNHYEKVDAASFTKAFAIVTAASLYTKLYELYAAYFKPMFPVKVFPTEVAALAWLEGLPD